MAQRKSSKSIASLLLVIVLMAALFVVKQCKKSPAPRETTSTPTTQTQAEKKGLNRNPSTINYSKHARCRMECRHISEAEVKDILQNGKVNYSKSEIGNNPDCQKKYAVEGKTTDGQRVRIIFAPCSSEVTVVTVIDLGKEWECDCG